MSLGTTPQETKEEEGPWDRKNGESLQGSENGGPEPEPFALEAKVAEPEDTTGQVLWAQDPLEIQRMEIGDFFWLGGGRLQIFLVIQRWEYNYIDRYS